jgi:hypothetical protein
MAKLQPKDKDPDIQQVIRPEGGRRLPNMAEGGQQAV